MEESTERRCRRSCSSPSLGSLVADVRLAELERVRLDRELSLPRPRPRSSTPLGLPGARGRWPARRALAALARPERHGDLHEPAPGAPPFGRAVGGLPDAEERRSGPSMRMSWISSGTLPVFVRVTGRVRDLPISTVPRSSGSYRGRPSPRRPRAAQIDAQRRLERRCGSRGRPRAPPGARPEPHADGAEAPAPSARSGTQVDPSATRKSRAFSPSISIEEICTASALVVEGPTRQRCSRRDPRRRSRRRCRDLDLALRASSRTTTTRPGPRPRRSARAEEERDHPAPPRAAAPPRRRPLVAGQRRPYGAGGRSSGSGGYPLSGLPDRSESAHPLECRLSP